MPRWLILYHNAVKTIPTDAVARLVGVDKRGKKFKVTKRLEKRRIG
jgi:hypothetical protein